MGSLVLPGGPSCKVLVHPVVLYAICDAYIRRDEGKPRVVGTLLGTTSPDGVVHVNECYAGARECSVRVGASARAWLRPRLAARCSWELEERRATADGPSRSPAPARSTLLLPADQSSYVFVDLPSNWARPALCDLRRRFPVPRRLPARAPAMASVPAPRSPTQGGGRAGADDGPGSPEDAARAAPESQSEAGRRGLVLHVPQRHDGGQPLP